MRKFILLMLLSVMSGSAMAEWVVHGNTSSAIYYVDPDTLRQNGTSVKMWNLRDYKISHETTEGQKFLSSIELIEYDCKNDVTRILMYSHYSERMGRGESVWSRSMAQAWSPLPPSSIGGSLWRFACGVQ